MVIALLLFQACLSMPAFASMQPEQKEVAISLFNAGHFDKALPAFSKLSYDYPYDIILKYYLGASMVETGNYSKEAEINLMVSAGQEVPAKVYYYLGRLYHATEKWNSAQRNYNRFRNNADSALIKELKIDELSELCFNEKNPFTGKTLSEDEGGAPDVKSTGAIHSPAIPGTAETIKAEKPAESELPGSSDLPVKAKQADQPHVSAAEVLKEKPAAEAPPQSKETISPQKIVAETGQVEPILPESTDGQVAEVSNIQEPLTEKEVLSEEKRQVILPLKFIHFTVNNRVTYLHEDMFQNENALTEYKNGEKKGEMLDSLLSEMEKLRKQYRAASLEGGSDELAQKIRVAELLSFNIKQERDQHLSKAAQLEYQWWQGADPSIYSKYAQVRDSFINLQRQQEIAEKPQIVIQVLEETAEIADTTGIVDEEDDTTGEGDSEDEIVYKIQIGTFSKKIPAQKKALFDKISKIRVIENYVNDEGVTVYTTGNVTDLIVAEELQNQLKLEGIKDAFIIAFQNGKRIPLPSEKR